MTTDTLPVSDRAREAARSVAVRTINDWRRRDGLTGYVHDENRVKDERNAIAAFEEIVAPVIEREITQHTADRVAELEAENARLSDLLDTERYKVAIGVQKIAKAVQARKWLSEPGRGSYTYDDERYQAEFGAALDEIYAALRPLQAIAQDWSYCPRDPLRVAANRRAALKGSSDAAG